jgi:hypothetical protein
MESLENESENRAGSQAVSTRSPGGLGKKQQHLARAYFYLDFIDFELYSGVASAPCSGSPENQLDTR